MLLTPHTCSGLVEIEQEFTVCLSIDGGNRESHDKNRGGGTYDKAMAGALNLLAARGSRPSPRIVLYQLDLRTDPGSYDLQFVELANRVDAWQRVQAVLPSGDANLITGQPLSVGGTDAVVEWPKHPAFGSEMLCASLRVATYLFAYSVTDRMAFSETYSTNGQVLS
jgi:hypothetical protein